MSEETKEPVEETPETPEARQEPAPENQEAEKKPRKKEKKEKGITFTREQVEKMELAAKQLESVKDQFTRLTAEYDNYRKRTIWNGPLPQRAARTAPTRRDWR